MPPSKKRCKGSALGDELVAAALEGYRKKRRLHEYERLELPNRIEREWKDCKSRIMRTAEERALSFHVFEFNAADKFHEFEPTVEDITNALPVALKEMMADPRYEVTVDQREDTGVFRIWIDAQEETFKANAREEAEAEDRV
tara:strand:- start:22 stop:447 length:426 start_codon:yes stop_codon:yes gene_type:complete